MRNIYIAILTVGIIMSSCIHNGIVCDKGSGKVIKQEVAKSGFKVINLSNSANLFITQGEEDKIVIETDDNIFNNLTTEVIDGELVLDNKNSICPSKLNYYITMKDIKGFKLTGSGSIIANSPIISDDLFVKITGSGDAKFDSVNVAKAGVMILGSGDVKIKGKAEKFASEINGSGDIYANGLVSDYCKVEINGSGDVRLGVNKELIIEINGSGDVYYHGNPSTFKSKSTGSGRVREIEKK